MQQRRLLPDETIVAIVDAALKAVSNTASVGGVDDPIVLVDGFPRSLRSAELADVRWSRPEGVYFFDCPRQLAETRFLERARSVDDSVDIFRTRYDEFERLNGEIVEMYGDIVVRIGTETGTEETWKVLRTSIDDLMVELRAIESFNA
jgi:adenylate kinase family enzyme